MEKIIINHQPKNVYLIMKLRFICTITFLLFTLYAFPQKFQPLGILNGSYSIKPNSSISPLSYCMDFSKDSPDPDLSYNKIPAGGDIKVKIGDGEYTLQDAINRQFISVESAKGYASIRIINNTDMKVTLDVDQALVFTQPSDNSKLLPVYALNTDFTGLGVSRQDAIWFSQKFQNFICDNEALLIQFGIISKDHDNLALRDFLKARNDFLVSNGIANRDLLANDMDALILLLHLKKGLQETQNSNSDKLFVINYFHVPDDINYYVDDGSPQPVCVTNKIENIFLKINSLTVKNENVYIDLRNFPSKSAEQDFMSAIHMYQDNHNSVTKIRRIATDIDNAMELLHKSPSIKMPGDIHKGWFDKIYEYDNTIELNNISYVLQVASENEKLLNSLSDTINKRFKNEGTTDVSIADILGEAKAELKSAFPNNNLEMSFNHMAFRIE